jgi:protease I
MTYTRPLCGVLITAEAFEDEEVMYPIMRLHEEGIVCDVATKGAKQVVGRLNFPLELIVRYYSKLVDAMTLNPDDYDFVLLPGGFEAPDRVRQMPEVLKFVRTMHRREKLVAAFCHGPWILISAKLLNGRCATGYIGIKDDIENAGATYINEPVVWDGNILTSRHPRDVGQFMKALIGRLNQ